jgi:hypothetical protein
MGRLLGLTAFFYGPANFLIAVHWLLERAAPERVGDAYVLSDHGRIVREVTAAEYWRLRGYEARLASGFALVYGFLAATYLLYLPPPVHVTPPNQALQPTWGLDDGAV